MDSLSQLKKSMDDMKDMFSKRMASFENSHSTKADKSVEDSDFQSFKAFIWKAVSNLQLQMELVAKSLEDLEMRSRTSVLLLHGVPEAVDEDVYGTALQICNDNLQLSNMSRQAFHVCHRLGRLHIPSKPRPILLRFVSPIERNLVWSSKTKLKGSGMMVSEFLTSTRHAVFVEARRIYGVKGSWTSDGRIVVLGQDGSRRRITTMAELLALPAPASKPDSVAKASDLAHQAPVKLPSTSRVRTAKRINYTSQCAESSN